jgi:hypothetical protein
MRQPRKRRYCTASDSAEIWDRWQRGEGLTSIGRVFGKNSGSIFSHISPTGGIRPSPRRRSRQALTPAERQEISRGSVNGHSLPVIACGMGRAPSTVSREIGRNGGRGCYRAAGSDRQAWPRALPPKACRLATHPQLRRVVARLLQRNWSPQQIAGRVRLNQPEDEAFCVSHKTIYRSLFVQVRGVLKKALIEHLRTHCPIRRSRHATAKADLRGRIPDTDLGPGLRTRRPQALHNGNRYRSVFPRSAGSLAAWIHREHQSLATTAFPPRHGSVGSQSGPIEPNGKRAQRTSSQDARLCFARRTISSLYCVDRLKRQPT